MNFSNSTARTTVLASLISGCMALSAFTSTPALAAADDAPPHAALSVRGVDFASPQAVAHLKHRLGRAATSICFRDNGRSLMMTPDEQACYATAVKDGLAQIASRQQQAVRDRAINLPA